MSVLFIGAHKISPALNLAAITAYLLRFVHTVGDSLSIGPISRERVFIPGGPVANSLLGARIIGWAEIARS